MKNKTPQEVLKGEMERMNEQEDDDEIEMSKSELRKEHEKLIKVLRSGSKAEQLREAAEQEKELKKYV